MLGTVTALRRYPVKSMLGEDVDASDVSRSGLARDRRLAVVSRRTGKVASAKYPRLWRDLLTLSAEALDEDVKITLPDGKAVSSSDADIDEVLAAVLHEPVTLTATPPPDASLDRAVPEAVLRNGVKAQVPAEIIEIGAGAPPGTFVDFAPLHLLTTSALDRIAGLSPFSGPTRNATPRCSAPAGSAPATPSGWPDGRISTLTNEKGERRDSGDRSDRASGLPAYGGAGGRGRRRHRDGAGGGESR
jgi:hypothetical protein